ncbi:hypothetical protein C8Q73DRAFT_746651 [Cubamyces lactineus]|nr:hypothetical protein C8Q73DRAFT_746651 [Cubamyces lactineus]
MYAHSDHPTLAPPAPVNPLPHGTVHIDEASYDGTNNLIKEWMRQLYIDEQDERMRTGTEHVLFWIGDQLTDNHLRGLANYRCEDLNGYNRMDWLVLVFGWFHILMVFANSLHRQYFGSLRVKIKGTFYHYLHKGIIHIAEAHFCNCWHQHNNFFQQSNIWNQDVLYYILLHRSMQSGNIGMMEDLLLHLLFWFSGGGNHKYAVEVLKLLQGLHREWPQNVK